MSGEQSGAVARPSGMAQSLTSKCVIFDDNDFPLAYLITFRCYGTWLHGDQRHSMNRRRNVYGTPRLGPSLGLQKAEIKQLKNPPVALSAAQRLAVEQAIREVCNHRQYLLRGINVRTNHVHTIVPAAERPEPILTAFKAYSTRCLRAEALIDCNSRMWSRHGSTVYLWKERDVSEAMDYVLLGQDKAFR